MTDIGTMMVNFAGEFSASLWKLLWAIGMLLGCVYTGKTLMRMIKANTVAGQPPVTLGSIIPILLIGGLMFNLPTFINFMWASVGEGEVSYNAISYKPAQNFGVLSEAVNSTLTLTSTFGGVFFIKGLMLLKRATLEGQNSQGSDKVGKSLTHMFGGVCLIQITHIIDAACESFGIFW